jgi:hypothetical protein
MRPSSNSQRGRKRLLARNHPAIGLLGFPGIIRKPLDAETLSAAPLGFRATRRIAIVSGAPCSSREAGPHADHRSSLD